MTRAGHACHPPCGERLAAQAAGLFGRDHMRGEWIRTDIPDRIPHARAIVRYALGLTDEKPLKRPYSWTCCPYCGGDLETPQEPT